MKLSLLVPFRSDDGPRARAWEYAREQWARELPDAEMVLADAEGPEFHKTSTWNLAARRASGDVFVMADADVIISGDLIHEAVAMGRPVKPFSLLRRLTREGTEQVYGGADPHSVPGQDAPPSIPIVLVLPREHYWSAGGMDERFRAWSGEDNAFQWALSTLVGPVESFDHGEVYHLWHPPQDKVTGRRENQALVERYRAALGYPERMLALVSED